MEEEQKKVSLVTCVIIFLGIIVITILLIQKLDISSYIFPSEDVYGGNSEEYIDRVASENDMYIKNIKSEYGITVLYGNDTKNFMSSIEASAQYDKNVINNNLKKIYQLLKKYPKEMFKIFKDGDYPLYVMLVSKFNNKNLALASKNNLNTYRLYISNTDKFEKAFHHELYHILEYYMLDENKYIYSSWYSFNPSNFKYEEDIDKLNNKYVINEENIFNSYFISKYSKVSEKEDRAEIFAEFMMLDKKEGFSKNILGKIKYIEKNLKKYVVAEDFYFSKYVN